MARRAFGRRARIGRKADISSGVRRAASSAIIQPSTVNPRIESSLPGSASTRDPFASSSPYTLSVRIGAAPLKNIADFADGFGTAGGRDKRSETEIKTQTEKSGTMPRRLPSFCQPVALSTRERKLLVARAKTVVARPSASLLKPHAPTAPDRPDKRFHADCSSSISTSACAIRAFSSGSWTKCLMRRSTIRVRSS